MAEREQLEAIVTDLIEILHQQARVLEKMASHIEQVTTRLPEAGELSAVRSGLTALELRVKKLRARG